MSYVRFEDEHEGGRLTQFRERLSTEVRVQTGDAFPIFQDRNDIAWGDHWQTRINESLDAATFLIPIITPSFFRSLPCREELKRFLERERQLDREDLILPVYYVTAPELDDPDRNEDELGRLLFSRQYADWRELRFRPFTSPVVRRALAQLAGRIRDSLLRPTVPLPTERNRTSPSDVQVVAAEAIPVTSTPLPEKPTVTTELEGESATAVQSLFGPDPREDYEQLSLNITLKFSSGRIPDYSEGVRLLQAKRDGAQLWWETVNYSVSNDYVDIVPVGESATVIRRLPNQFHGYTYYELRLPNALQHGDVHNLWVRKHIHDRSSEPSPVFYCSARRPILRMTTRVEFAPDALPKRVLRFVAPTSRMPDAADLGQPVRVQATGVVEQVFSDLVEGVSYGLRWFW
jgi:TIR domain